jgi:hypothetical protein
MMMHVKNMVIKHSRWEAIRSDAKYKSELEERRLKIKEAKAMKIMMIDSTSRMNEAELELHQMMPPDNLERRRLARQGGGASSSVVEESPMSGGDGGVHDELRGEGMV